MFQLIVSSPHTIQFWTLVGAIICAIIWIAATLKEEKLSLQLGVSGYLGIVFIILTLIGGGFDYRSASRIAEMIQNNPEAEISLRRNLILVGTPPKTVTKNILGEERTVTIERSFESCDIRTLAALAKKSHPGLVVKLDLK
jgi:hypothetical protein